MENEKQEEIKFLELLESLNVSKENAEIVLQTFVLNTSTEDFERLKKVLEEKQNE